MLSIAACSAAGSRLVICYQSRSWRATIGRKVMGSVARLAGSSNPMADEPWRSKWTPATIRQLLNAHGFAVVSDEDLVAVVQRLSLTVGSRRSAGDGRVRQQQIADVRQGALLGVTSTP